MGTMLDYQQLLMSLGLIVVAAPAFADDRARRLVAC